MDRGYYRVTAVVGLLLAGLFASAVMPVSQARMIDPATRGLTGEGLWPINTGGPDPAGGGQAVPDRIRFSFRGYGNPQRPFPGYVGPFQLGPVSISGSGELRGSDGALLSGGLIIHSDDLRDRRYPTHRTTWQVVKGLNVQNAGGRTVLRLQVQVVGSNYANICPVGTLGVIDLIDDNRRLANGHTADGIRTEMPNPPSLAPDGGAACRTHTHGMNNENYSWTDPPSGGPPSGGIWAIVEISGTGGHYDLSGTWSCSDGGTYVINHAGNRVVWEGRSGDGGRSWTHSFEGTIQGDRIVGYFRDKPPGAARQQGSLTVRIASNSRLEKVASSVVFGGSVWTRGAHGSEFEITSVSSPSSVKLNGPRGALRVAWAGNPTFPVKMVYAPDSCPPGLNCATVTETFTTPANPLVFQGSVWCFGQLGSAVLFDYSVYLVDATGKKTKLKNADFTCYP
jgi:hypothetical protein